MRAYVQSVSVPTGVLYSFKDECMLSNLLLTETSDIMTLVLKSGIWNFGQIYVPGPAWKIRRHRLAHQG